MRSHARGATRETSGCADRRRRLRRASRRGPGLAGQRCCACPAPTSRVAMCCTSARRRTTNPAPLRKPRKATPSGWTLTDRSLISRPSTPAGFSSETASWWQRSVMVGDYDCELLTSPVCLADAARSRSTTLRRPKSQGPSVRRRPRIRPRQASRSASRPPRGDRHGDQQCTTGVRYGRTRWHTTHPAGRGVHALPRTRDAAKIPGQQRTRLLREQGAERARSARESAERERPGSRCGRTC